MNANKVFVLGMLAAVVMLSGCLPSAEEQQKAKIRAEAREVVEVIETHVFSGIDGGVQVIRRSDGRHWRCPLTFLLDDVVDNSNPPTAKTATLEICDQIYGPTTVTFESDSGKLSTIKLLARPIEVVALE